MSGQVLTFANYSPARWQALKADLATKGIAIDADSGDGERDGVKLHYEYADNVLVVTVDASFIKRPFAVSEISKEVNGIQA